MNLSLEDLRLIPDITMSFEEKLYTTIKLFFFICIIMALVFNDIKYFLLSIILLIIGFFVYYHKYEEDIKKENFLDSNNLDIVNDELCNKPTIDNPFMNPSVMDYQNKNDIKACYGAENKIKNLFKKRIFKDVNDLYDKNISERQFYTVPSTTIPNDQEKFATWLYNKDKTCKENNGEQCFNNIM